VNALHPGVLGNNRCTFAGNYCHATCGSRSGGIHTSTNSSSSSSSNCSVFTSVRCNGATYSDELHALLSATVMIRRLKRDVLSQLPPLRRTLVRVEPNKCELKAVLDSRERDGVCRFAEDAYDLDNSEFRGPASDMSIEQTEGLLKAPGAAEWVSHS
jgi:hypothetical protein